MFWYQNMQHAYSKSNFIVCQPTWSVILDSARKLKLVTTLLNNQYIIRLQLFAYSIRDKNQLRKYNSTQRIYYTLHIFREFSHFLKKEVDISSLNYLLQVRVFQHHLLSNHLQLLKFKACFWKHNCMRYFIWVLIQFHNFLCRPFYKYFFKFSFVQFFLHLPLPF